MTALSPSQPDRPFHGLWSLWDMFELKAGAFYDTVTHLASLSSFIAGRSSVGAEAGETKPFHRETKIDDISQPILLKRLSDLEEHLVVLGARVTLIAVQETHKFLSWDYATWHHAEQRLEEIRNTLKRELSLITLLVLEPKEQGYYAPPQPHFGSDVATKFATNAAFEIDEAAKCLALGRPTAAVFHLMRVMEIGIYATASCLGIPDPVKPSERNWGKILEKVWDGIEKRWPTTTIRMTGDGALFEGVYASLDAVKNPWRNGTMHVENKYTEDEAQHIFIAVRGFMMKLASRCDESGLPLA